MSRIMAMQSINQCLLKRLIFKPTTYTSRKRPHQGNEIKIEREREESGKKRTY